MLDSNILKQIYGSLLTNEEFRPLMYRNITSIPGYYLTTYGRVISTKRNKVTLLSITNRDRGVGGAGNHSSIAITKPKGLFIDEFYGVERKAIPCMVHQLVMWTFKPIDDHPPNELAKTWNEIITPEMVGQPRITEEWKQWVRDTVWIDHIDDNPFNNHVDNLRYVKPKDNNRQRKHHGNKSEDSV